ncbi:hypothetical protein QVD17_29211 [Tagetes erecta]|uniref:DUF1639 family protein n=1 Tax=Tagetes erecta TaxID=13708 RepID=A0AAD8NSN5_TARER|nr:hypothetical protein QVD17_29211 [Tagetes erecta]
MDRLKPKPKPKPKPLHNFDLPCLKWGNQKLLRCMKIESNSNGDVSVSDRNQSSESNGAGDGGGMRRRSFEMEKRFRSSDDYKFCSSEKVKTRIGIAGDGEIEATREKLMFDFQNEVVKMKDAILRQRDPLPSLATAPAPAPATAAAPETATDERPWNLRTRRAALNGNNTTSEVLKPNSSPVRNDCKLSNLRHTISAGDANTERLKLSVSLSRRELEDDFMAMAGRRLPRKPKKRPRIVQKQLDTLFPGLWLSEITADLYKVPDEIDTAKR